MGGKWAGPRGRGEAGRQFGDLNKAGMMNAAHAHNPPLALINLFTSSAVSGKWMREVLF